MIQNIIFIIIGFIILIKGADLFVDGIVSTADNLKISKIVIALTVVAFGTSAPEFAISVQASSDPKSSFFIDSSNDKPISIPPFI